MIKLTIDNSYSKIEGLTTSQHKQLADALSYNIDQQVAYFSNSSWNRKRTLLDKKGNFPSGVHYKVQYWLYKYSIEYKIDDKRILPKPLKRLFTLTLVVPLRQAQIDASRACCSHYRGTVAMVTASGKSITMAALINELQLKTLIIVPNLTLKRQLKASFLEYFGSLDNITVENIDSGTLAKETDYDVLIVDESHHVAASTYRKLNKKSWSKIYYRFFFTGTPYRSRDEEQILMESISGQIIYELDYHKAVASKIITPIEAYYYELPKRDVEGYTWSQVYSELVVNNSERNLLISKLLINLQQASISTLCLVKEIRHGDNIVALTGIPFANGENENTTSLIYAFNRGKAPLIGTTGVLGEGSDTKPAEYGIISGLGKSRPALVQQIGRLLRLYPGKETAKVILFLDRSHKWTRAHFAAQVKTLKEVYNVKPIKLEI